MLIRVVKAVTNISNEIVVATKSERIKIYSHLLGSKVKIVPDDPPVSFSLLAGINAGIKALNTEYIVVIAGDMPFVNPDVIKLLAKRASLKDAVVPLWPDGLTEPLLSIYKREHLLKTKILLGKAQNRATDLIRGANRVGFVSVNELRSIDKNLASLRSINTPEDLKNEDESNVFGRALSFDLDEHASHFWMGVDGFLKGLYLKAKEAFYKEAEVYRRFKLSHLRVHALSDAVDCSKRVKTRS